MRFLHDLLTNPLFIIKRLQAQAFGRHAHYLSGRVLDVGCGDRPYRRFISCEDYTGLDACEKVRPDVIAKSESLPFEDGRFDSAVCTEVLEHVRDPRKSLSEIRRVLKSGGTLYLTAPQAWGLHYEPDDYWRFTRYGLAHLLEISGFEVICVERIGGLFSSIGQEVVDFVWTKLTRLLRFLGPRGAERAACVLCFVPSFVFYVFAKLTDRLDQRFAIGWAFVGRGI